MLFGIERIRRYADTSNPTLTGQAKPENHYRRQGQAVRAKLYRLPTIG